MFRPLPQLAASVAVCTLAFAILPINAEDEANSKEEMLLVSYQIADLPVWTSGGVEDEHFGFNPKVLVALIESKIGPESSPSVKNTIGPPMRWSNGESSIAIHRSTASLVIRSTRENQRKIADLLGELRGNPADARLEERKHSLKDKSESKRLGGGARAGSLFFDPDVEQLKQHWNSPLDDPIDLPADVEVLVERFSVPSPQRSWPVWNDGESPNVPTN